MHCAYTRMERRMDENSAPDIPFQHFSPIATFPTLDNTWKK